MTWKIGLILLLSQCAFGHGGFSPSKSSFGGSSGYNRVPNIFSQSSGGFGPSSGGFSPSSGGFSHSSGGGFGGGFGGFQRGNFGGSSAGKSFDDPALRARFERDWKATGTIPDLIPRVPEEPLIMKVDGKIVYPNTPVKTSSLSERFPEFEWKTEPGALYSLYMEDQLIEIQPVKLAHLLVVNIPGNDISKGDVIFDWQPNWTFDKVEGEDKIDTDKQSPKNHMALVYKQNGRIDIPAEEQNKDCPGDQSLFNRAALDHNAFQERFNLEAPYAGTHFILRYEPGWSEYWMCVFSTCGGNPLPFPVPGINENLEPADASQCDRLRPMKYRGRWFYKPLQHLQKYRSSPRY